MRKKSSKRSNPAKENGILSLDSFGTLFWGFLSFCFEWVGDTQTL
jgi:hypothetical protein